MRWLRVETMAPKRKHFYDDQFPKRPIMDWDSRWIQFWLYIVEMWNYGYVSTYEKGLGCGLDKGKIPLLICFGELSHFCSKCAESSNIATTISTYRAMWEVSCFYTANQRRNDNVWCAEGDIGYETAKWCYRISGTMRKLHNPYFELLEFERSLKTAVANAF